MGSLNQNSNNPPNSRREEHKGEPVSEEWVVSGGQRISAHGNAFHLRCLILIAKQVDREGYKFDLITEVKEPSALDDGILFWYKGNECYVTLMQMKSSVPNKEITMNDLIPNDNPKENMDDLIAKDEKGNMVKPITKKNKGPFHLVKYFESFCKSKSKLTSLRPEKQVVEQKVCLITNRKISKSLRDAKWFKMVEDLPTEFKLLGQKKGAAFKLRPGKIKTKIQERSSIKPDLRDVEEFLDNLYIIASLPSHEELEETIGNILTEEFVPSVAGRDNEFASKAQSILEQEFYKFITARKVRRYNERTFKALWAYLGNENSLEKFLEKTYSKLSEICEFKVEKEIRQYLLNKDDSFLIIKSQHIELALIKTYWTLMKLQEDSVLMYYTLPGFCLFNEEWTKKSTGYKLLVFCYEDVTSKLNEVNKDHVQKEDKPKIIFVTSKEINLTKENLPVTKLEISTRFEDLEEEVQDKFRSKDFTIQNVCFTFEKLLQSSPNTHWAGICNTLKGDKRVTLWKKAAEGAIEVDTDSFDPGKYVPLAARKVPKKDQKESQKLRETFTAEKLLEEVKTKENTGPFYRLTIVSGDWGSGKTTLMKNLKSLVNDDAKYLCFNISSKDLSLLEEEPTPFDKVVMSLTDEGKILIKHLFERQERMVLIIDGFIGLSYDRCKQLLRIVGKLLENRQETLVITALPRHKEEMVASDFSEVARYILQPLETEAQKDLWKLYCEEEQHYDIVKTNLSSFIGNPLLLTLIAENCAEYGPERLSAHQLYTDVVNKKTNIWKQARRIHKRGTEMEQSLTRIAVQSFTENGKDIKFSREYTKFEKEEFLSLDIIYEAKEEIKFTDNFLKEYLCASYIACRLQDFDTNPISKDHLRILLRENFSEEKNKGLLRFLEEELARDDRSDWTDVLNILKSPPDQGESHFTLVQRCLENRRLEGGRGLREGD